jgi:hypothetical protein
MLVAYLKKKIPTSIKSPDFMALLVCIDVLAVTVVLVLLLHSR